MLQRKKVLELAGMRLRDRGALRLELAQPPQGALEPVHSREWMKRAVGDDAEAVAARAERNQPHPVADAHQMYRALPAQPGRHAPAPRLIVGPVVDLHSRA